MMKRVFSIFIVFVAILSFIAADVHGRSKDAVIDSRTKENLHSQQAGKSDTIIDPNINWPTFCGVQQTGEINALFNCFGQFGNGFSYCFVPGWPTYVSFESPPESGVEYLFAGAVWVGAVVGQDTLVSVGADGWQAVEEMFPPEYPARGSVTKFDYPTDFSMRAEFTDTVTEGVDPDYFGRPHIPLNIRIVNRSHVWRTDPQNWTVIYDMVITNIGDLPIDSGYVGFYFDADVCFDCGGTMGFTDDVTGSILTSDSERIAYIIDNDGDFQRPPEQRTPRIFAFKFLETSFEPLHSSFNWWISNGTSALDFGPRERPYMGLWKEPFRDFGTGGLGTPEGDVNKYYLLRNREIDYDQVYTCVIPEDDTLWMYPQTNPEACGDFDNYADGSDTRFLFSVGPFNLLPDSAMRFQFATFTGDSVHTDPTNLDNLPDNPDQYLANLDFTHMLENAVRSDSLAQSLLDPLLPVTGLLVDYKDDDSVVVRWDPWVFDDVEGYEVYLWEVPPDSLPYPGVVPPWLEPDQLNLVASLGRSHHYSFDALSPGTFYLANVANRTTTKSVGDPGEPLAIWLGDRGAPPVFDNEYVFVEEGNPEVLTWTAPEGISVAHYNVYRFEDSASAAQKYYPFYDEGYHAQFLAPKDTFFVNGQYYYYYARDVYAQVDGSAVSYTDFNVDDGTVYVITAVDSNGFESLFSKEVTTYVVEPRTKDILVVTYSGTTTGFVIYDSVKSFYDSILSGYSYDIYKYSDSIKIVNCPSGDPLICFDWHDFMRYRLLILDEGIVEWILSDLYESGTKGFTKYLLSGGYLAYFGSFNCLQTFSLTDARYYPATHEFIQRFFGIDSIFYVSPYYFSVHSLPLVDTFFAFSRAEPVGSMPELSYDTSRYPFTSMLQTKWPTNTPPSVSTFKVNDSGEVTHVFKALLGVNSMNEDEPIGVKSTREGTQTYLFGFHLWYMTYEEGQALINAIMTPPAKAIIDPDTMYAIYDYAIDTMTATVHVGDFSGGRTPTDIAPSTMRVNGTIAPISWQILPSYPEFTGEVMEMIISIPEFVAGYGIFLDTSMRSFTVTGKFTDNTDFVGYGTVTLVGYICGDVNSDAQVNVADIVYFVDFLFRGGSPPLIEKTADVDGNCRLNVVDITYLVNYLFRGGSSPIYCPM
jgi:hypothetical protein